MTEYKNFEKIPQSEIDKASVAKLRTVPGRGGTYGENGLTADELKELFDALPKLAIERLHALLAYLDAYINGTGGLESRLGTIGDTITIANTGISENSAAISAEVTARKQAISAEEKARNTAINSAISAEVVARDNAIEAALKSLIDNAPDELNTLKELAEALANEGSATNALIAKISEVEASLAGKVDTKDVSTTATTDTIAKRISGGRLAVGRAAADFDAVPYKQMREELERYLVNGGGLPPDLLDGITNAIKMIDTLEAKVANLEAGLAPDMFTVDDTTAYIKTIPTDAAPYAEIQAVEGRTYLTEGMDADLVVLVGDGNNFDIQIDLEYGIISVGVPPTSTTYYTTAPFSSIFKDAEIGKTYMLTYTVSGSTGGFLSIGQWPNRPNLNVPFTLTSDIYNSSIEFTNSMIDTEAGMYADTAYFSNLKLTEIGGATRYAKVTEIVSKGIYGNVIGTLRIPAEVQSLDGYGESGYRIAWDEDGKPWWYTPDGRTDISQYFAEDNLIAVEGGGTITAVNENGLAAPTTIVYQATGQSLADAFDEVHQYAMKVIGGNS